MKQVDQLRTTNKKHRKQLRDDSIKYIKPTKPKKVYIKVALREQSGNVRFISQERQIVENAKDVRTIWNNLFTLIQAIYNNADIIGYEIEEVTEES